MGRHFPTACLKSYQYSMAGKSSTDLYEKGQGVFPEMEGKSEEDTTLTPYR